MKHVIVAALAVLLSVGQSLAAETAKKPEAPKDKASYAIGMKIGQDMMRDKLEINPEMLVQGLKDSLTNKQTLLTEKEMVAVLQSFQQERMEAARIAGEKAAQEGAAFLAANAKKDGVITLPSGLQYKILTPGKGSRPTKDSTVTVHYRGTLIDGTEFDSSHKRGEATTLPVNGVIAGWTEALQLMQEGAKWQLFIPSTLAYGARGAGESIGPNSTLIFEVELISVAK